METICWEAHTSDLTSSVAKLYHNVEFMDCVLDTDGGLVNAHRVILAACSPYFKNLLVDYDSMVPIPLKEIKYSDMKCLLDFIYNGEVNVRMVDVSSFMRTVKFLQVASLTRFYSNFTDNVSCNNGSEIQMSCSSTLSGVNHLNHEGEDFTEKGSPGVSEEVDGLIASTESTEFQSICITVSESVDVSKQLSEVRNNSDLGDSSFKSHMVKTEIVDEDRENFQDHLNPISFVAVSPFSEDVEGHDDKSFIFSDTELKNPLEEYSFDCNLTKERIVKRENDLKIELSMQMCYEEMSFSIVQNLLVNQNSPLRTNKLFSVVMNCQIL